MTTYDYMYLLTKEQYERQHKPYSNIDGVGGDIRESQVNNIEVTRGGSVTIHDKEPRVENCNHNDQNQDNISFQPRPRSPTPDPRRGTGSSRIKSSYASVSTKLSRGKQEPNAIRPRTRQNSSQENSPADEHDENNIYNAYAEGLEDDDVEMRETKASKRKHSAFESDLRRDALENDRRSKMPRIKNENKNKKEKSEKMETDVAMKQLVKQRLNELRGIKKKPSVTKGVRQSIPNTNRKIIHEMRDIHKASLREQAYGGDLDELLLERGKKRLFQKEEDNLDDGVSPSKRYKQFHYFSRPVVKRKMEDNDILSNNKRPNKTVWKPVSNHEHIIPFSRKRHWNEDEEDIIREGSSKKSRRGPSPPPKSKAVKRSATLDERRYKRMRKGPSPPPTSTAIKRPASLDDRKYKRARRGPSPPPTSKALKRPIYSSEDELDPFEYSPPIKTRNNRSARVRAIGKYAGVKRSRDDYSDSEEEYITGIPFKKKLVTYNQ